MDESLRLELEQLKDRQAGLAKELAKLQSELQSLESRLFGPLETPSPEAGAQNDPGAPAPSVHAEFSPRPALFPLPLAANPAAAVHPPPLPSIRPSPGRPTPPSASAAAHPPFDPAPTTAREGGGGRSPEKEAVPASRESLSPADARPAANPGATKPGTSAAPGQPAPPTKDAFEMRLGKYWLVRIGIVMLLTGLAFFGAYAYENFIPRLGAGGKIGLLYLAGAMLLAAGGWIHRKQEALHNFAQVLIAGGLAAVYFTTYAAHHVAALQVIPSALADGLLLLAWATVIAWLADRLKSEVMALFAILLAYYSSAITHAGLFTLYSNLILASAAVFFLVRNRWAKLSLASLCATYAGYGFWRFYQDGVWTWASPAEGLTTGIYFLVSYWCVFTAGLFLAEDDRLPKTRRATLLSLNNGLFFAAYVSTMFQAHAGGFWKFSLTFGAVLLGLTVAAWKLRRADRLLWNTCLTQSLLLLTLGLVTHYAGFQLSLLLAAESMALAILGIRLNNRVMSAGSYLASALAFGWAITTLRAFNHHDLACAAIVALALLANAFSARREVPLTHARWGPRVLFYTILALVLCFAATWRNNPQEWRSLILTGEGSLFLLTARPLRNAVLEDGALCFAALGAVTEILYLDKQCAAFPLTERTGMGPAIVAGAMLVGDALWQRRTPIGAPANLVARVSAFACFGFAIWLAATLVFTPTDFRSPLLALEALLLTAAFYPWRLTEAVAAGQLYLLVAQLLWLRTVWRGDPAPPWWNPSSIIAMTLALSYWWQRQRSLKLPSAASLALQGAYALALVGVLEAWLRPRFAGPGWPAFAGLLAVALTAYGIALRAWLIAAAGQTFVLLCACAFYGQFQSATPGWAFPLGPIAALLLLSLGASAGLRQRLGEESEITQFVLKVGTAYRIVATIMALWWIAQYIDPSLRCVVSMATGLALFVLCGWRGKQEALIFAGVFSLAGVARFWLPPDGASTVTWPNLAALMVLPAQQRLTRRWPARFPLTSTLNASLIVTGGLSLWLLLTRWMHLQTEGFYVTASWSAFALALFIAGMIWQERVYRWLGLSVLACAVGRLVIFDIWSLARIYQILSFMALGLVLVLLGFLYNKYQERLKDWL